MFALASLVVETLSTATLPFDPTVRDAYGPVVESLPLVTVEELDNIEREFGTVNGELLSFIPVQIDVYGEAIAEGGVLYSAAEVARDIADAIVAECLDLNLTRVYARMLPFDREDTTRRFTMRYEAVVDSQGNITKTR